MKKRAAQTSVIVAALTAMTVTAAAAATFTISEPTIVFQAGDPVVEIVDKNGTGALSLETEDMADKAQVLVTQFADGTLDDLESLSYRTYREHGDGEQVASLNITVDPWAGTFVYEPVYDTSDQTVGDGVWQVWDAFSDDARWWRSGFPDTFVTWEEIIDGVEDAEVAAIMVNQGSGNPTLHSFVDWVEVNGDTYDFAPAQPTKDDCKDGGYADLEFRNQGQCVASFQANPNADR